MRIEEPKGLAADQVLVFRRLARLVRGRAKTDARYDTLHGAHGGKVISADVARFLAPEFAAWDGRVRHTPSTGSPAGAYAHDRVLRDIARHERGKTLLITAGGAGAGKSTALEVDKPQGGPLIREADLVFDNQLRHFGRSRRIIDAALHAGWSVRVLYVHRPFHEVVPAVAERSLRTGRWNRLHELSSTHIECRRTFVGLIRSLRHSDRVSFQCVIHTANNAPSRLLDATEASALLRRGMQTSRSRRILRHAFEKQVGRFLLNKKSFLASAEAVASCTEDFLSFIGDEGKNS